jgi:hypothetical protein
MCNKRVKLNFDLRPLNLLLVLYKLGAIIEQKNTLFAVIRTGGPTVHTPHTHHLLSVWQVEGHLYSVQH